MSFGRRALGMTGIELPVAGIRASKPFDVFGKEAQASRSRLVRTAMDRQIDFFATSPDHGEASHILAAGLIGIRHRATVMTTISNPDTPAAYREIDVALHLFDGRIDILLAEWQAASDALLASLARMRAMGDAIAFGVTCRSISDLRKAAATIIVEGFDVISIPATLLVSSEVHQLLSTINSQQCSILSFIPDGLDEVRGENLDMVKINLARHRLESLQDVLAKFALSDDRISSVLYPARRIRDLDRIERLAASRHFTAAEMDALRTG